MHSIVGMATVQVALGITALLNCVPVHLGALHQTGALVLFTLLLGALHSVRPVTPHGFGRFSRHLGVNAFGIVVVLGMGMLTQFE